MTTSDQPPSVNDVLALERQSSGDGSFLPDAPGLVRGGLILHCLLHYTVYVSQACGYSD